MTDMGLKSAPPSFSRHEYWTRLGRIRIDLMSLKHFKLVVDGRRSFDSGVGAVIRNCLFEFSKASIRGKVICSSIEDADRLKVICPEWDIVATKTTGYSVKEQCELPRLLKGNDVAWIPHYNIPIVTGVPLVTTIHDIETSRLTPVFSRACQGSSTRI